MSASPPRAPALISVVVANWNGCRYLEQCLSSLAAQTYPAVEVIVVDNGSSDGSVGWLAEHFPAVRVVANDTNRGFAVANNQGIAAAHGAFVALLNNDAWAEPDWLANLYAAAETEARVGAVASLMLLAARPDTVDSAGICVDRLGISWDRAGGQTATGPVMEPAEVFGACAGAALYRREMLAELGGFDEDFFAYLEDVDLAWRASWLGWRARYAPNARVYHIHSGTSGEGSAFKTYWLARNKIILLLKDYPACGLWRLAPLMLLYDGLSLVNTLLAQRNLSAWRGRLAGWRQAGTSLRKRRSLQARARLAAAEVAARLAPAAWPWQVAARYRHVTAQVPPGGSATSALA